VNRQEGVGTLAFDITEGAYDKGIAQAWVYNPEWAGWKLMQWEMSKAKVRAELKKYVETGFPTMKLYRLGKVM